MFVMLGSKILAGVSSVVQTGIDVRWPCRVLSLLSLTVRRCDRRMDRHQTVHHSCCYGRVFLSRRL